MSYIFEKSNGKMNEDKLMSFIGKLYKSGSIIGA